jgi:hypothetical protein
MGYFPNMTSWEYWAADNCFRCSHWPKNEEAPGCPVEMAHALYSYEMCNAEDNPAKIILDMLIPDGKTGPNKCAMFSPRNGVSDKHLRDWEKYKAVMAEATKPAPNGGRG